jgi:hypothetical protein
MSTFEEKYRKKASSTGQAAVETEAPPSAPVSDAMDVLREAAKDEYKAFFPSAHPETDLWVRVSNANKNADVAMPYSYRNHMIYDGAGFVISMQFGTPVISVTLHGRNLQDLWRKLLSREVQWVMEYDPKKWEALPADAACITGIEIVRKPLPEGDDDVWREKNPTASTATH